MDVKESSNVGQRLVLRVFVLRRAGMRDGSMALLEFVKSFALGHASFKDRNRILTSSRFQPFVALSPLARVPFDMKTVVPVGNHHMRLPTQFA